MQVFSIMHCLPWGSSPPQSCFNFQFYLFRGCLFFINLVLCLVWVVSGVRSQQSKCVNVGYLLSESWISKQSINPLHSSDRKIAPLSSTKGAEEEWNASKEIVFRLGNHFRHFQSHRLSWMEYWCSDQRGFLFPCTDALRLKPVRIQLRVIHELTLILWWYVLEVWPC